MIYCENIVNVALFFFLLLPRFQNHIYFSPPAHPHFRHAIATIVTKFFFPISAMALPQLVCHNFFFFSFHFGHSTHATHLVSRNWVEEFRYSHYRNSTCSLSFFFFSLILFVEFRQWWYQNSLSFLTILNNFQQFL